MNQTKNLTNNPESFKKKDKRQTGTEKNMAIRHGSSTSYPARPRRPYSKSDTQRN